MIDENRMKKNVVEKFYKDAFCAENAEVLINLEKFKIQSVVRITTTDNRGVFYVGRLEEC